MTDVSIECVGSIQSTAQNSKAAEGSVLLEENNDDQSEMQLKIPCKKDFLFLEELGEGSFSTGKMFYYCVLILLYELIIKFFLLKCTWHHRPPQVDALR
jgi:hypothetical protein